MKKIFVLSAAILAVSSFPASAGSSFHIGFFSPAPVYVAPQPAYVTYPYQVVETYHYPRYRHVSYRNWGHERCERNHKHHWKHRRDWDDDRDNWRGRSGHHRW